MNGALFLCILACMAAAAGAAQHDDGAPQEPLRFRKEGDFLKFKVLVFGDLHFGEGSLLDLQSSEFQERMMMLEAPVDLVVLNGDMSSNYAAPWFCKRANHQVLRKMCQNWWVERWTEYTGPMVKHKVPYAMNLGNHDALEALDATGRSLLAHDMQANFPISYTQVGPENVSRASNYFIPIYPPLSAGNTTDNDAGDGEMAGIWILDSGSTTCLGSAGWGCVLPDQVAWFRQEAKRRAGVPSHMFVHIPVEEALHLWNRKQMSAAGHDRGHVAGSALDSIDCSAVNTGLFAAISEQDTGVKGLWHGHDHNNDYWGSWAPPTGPVLGYGRKSGFGGET